MKHIHRYREGLASWSSGASRHQRLQQKALHQNFQNLLILTVFLGNNWSNWLDITVWAKWSIIRHMAPWEHPEFIAWFLYRSQVHFFDNHCFVFDVCHYEKMYTSAPKAWHFSSKTGAIKSGEIYFLIKEDIFFVFFMNFLLNKITNSIKTVNVR